MNHFLKAYGFKTVLLILNLGLLQFSFILPNPLFHKPYSTVLNDRGQRLLSARIADDGQWRFPLSDSLPPKFVAAITCFEDEYFFRHTGFNPVSMVKALSANIREQKIVSGGSTLTMQVIRLARRKTERTFYEKLVETIWAIRLETRYSKEEILQLYAAHAPFGGNVVGLETAAWRYYGRSMFQLSWGEMATLAVLPNAPSLIYPGKNQEKLLAKRNRLLDKLLRQGKLDAETCELAKAEPIPPKAFNPESESPHLLNRAIADGKKGQRITTTIDFSLQERISQWVKAWYEIYSQNEIRNMAVLVLDVKNNQVLAYVGNTPGGKDDIGQDVDIIMAPRSTGSTLKPFLYTLMLQEGLLLPKSLVQDVPTQIAGYSPKNFDEKYDGLVPADEALARSLNVPAVRMLQDYSVDRFWNQLQRLHLQHINKYPSHYGLSLILGGAESSLWDLSQAYLLMAQQLNDDVTLYSANYDLGEMQKKKQISRVSPLNKEALWWTAEALSGAVRPWQEAGWDDFQSAQKIAWKTGTSFGHRDAWSIGFTPDYVVGVWVGNANGEGRPGLTGLSMAAPVMFKVFNLLPESTHWFKVSSEHLITQTVCAQTGFLASSLCPDRRQMKLPAASRLAAICPFHQQVHLDSTGQFRVNSSCYPVHAMKTEVRLVIPPLAVRYYKTNHPGYQSLPPYLANCVASENSEMEVVYPKDYSKLFIPRGLNGKREKVVFEIVHRQMGQTVYWHLDESYLGQTTSPHRWELDAAQGKHQMTLVDGQGQTLSFHFEILEK